MASRLRSDQRGALLAGGGMLLVSLDSLGFRLTEADSWDIAFWFGVFTAIALTTLLWLRTQETILAIARRGGWPLFVSAALQACSTTFFILAIGMTTVANTVVIVAASPVVAAFIAQVALGERTTRQTWVAIAISIGGILVVASGSLGGGRIGGDLFAVAAIVAFSTNLTLWRGYPELNRTAAIGLGGLTMALVAAPLADPSAVTTNALLILAVLGGVLGPAGRIAIATATLHLSPARVSLFTPLETIAATVWAWLFLAETPPEPTLVGGVIVLGAVIYGAAAPESVP